MAVPNREPRRQKSLVMVLTAVVALTALAIWLAFAILRPTPPHSVAMAIGPEGSFNAELGKRYREFLARDGIELSLIATAGAVESVARLQDPKSGISIIIIPGGMTNRQDSPSLVSLGTLFYEPLWLFSRGDLLEKRKNLEDLRIAVGPEGSGAASCPLNFLLALE